MHTQSRGQGPPERERGGRAFYPAFMIKARRLLLFTIPSASIALLGSPCRQINPIWLFVLRTPADISAGSQPDFYMGFLEGSPRLNAAWVAQPLRRRGGTLAMSVLIPPWCRWASS
ncbi:hypothetical protein [Streptosporangium vulgare]|uniref:hypothetical protein n=1 Tax=Streptosporangium vulgare TaxID=46190 RepID=UPI0031DB4D3C